MSNLKGKVCLVTGAGRGLGNEIVKTLIQAGAAVTGCDIRSDLLESSKEMFAMNVTPKIVFVKPLIDSGKSTYSSTTPQ
jgi:NAD(P)-dependent dehydrogenase (short-subunit alcohol dehydrogenase family)